MDQIILYNYYRSSASYRVRIALHHKKIPFEYRSVNLVQAVEQFSADYRKLSPMAQVPCLIHNGKPITQSLAIIQYLDDVFPAERLFPVQAYERALALQISEIINSGIQPFQNRAVIAELVSQFNATEADKTKWIHHYIHKGFEALEEILKKTAGQHCIGDAVTVADCCLVPQVFGALRFGVDLEKYREIRRLNENSLKLEAFQLAEPSRQLDAV